MKKYLNKRNIVLALGIIQLIIAVCLGIQLVSMNLLPVTYLIVYVLLEGLLFGLTVVFSGKNKRAIVMAVLSGLVAIVMIFGMFALERVNQTVQEVTSNPEEVKTEMVVVVLADSEAEEITDLSQFLVAYMEDDSAKQIIDEINSVVGSDLNYHSFESATDMVDALYAKTINAMIMNKAYIDVLTDTEGYEDFSEKTKIIYSHEIVKYINLINKGDSNLEQFVVYISGIDVWGHVSVTSRSDVNILAIVNTKTKQIQLINTPRDYYVELPVSNGAKDKLTHAGIYGVDSSIGALEMLYDVEIDYFVRMNFSGFEAIIDSLGGIDVYSEYDFTVEPIKHYKKGINHLTGLEALAFARERYAFKDGDHQRGKNQMAVVTAMIDKLMSPELLYNYTEVLDAVEGTFQTNMSAEEIYALVKGQLANPGAWSIETYSVTGTGGSETTYSTPNTKCYVMIPNEDDVQEAKEKIAAVLGAE